MTDVEALARKLAPLMPERIAAWLKARDLADPEMRAMIDREITATAHRTLGNFREKLLLSLPSKGGLPGPYHLGTIVYDREWGPVGLTSSELLQGMVILGRSGAGKTNLAFHLLHQLTDRGVPWLFLDHKQTARHLLANNISSIQVFTAGRSVAPFPFNPFIAPPGLEPNVYAAIVVDVLAAAFGLGDAAVSVLQTALKACYISGNAAPSVDDVVTELERIPGTDRVRGWKASALRALQGIGFTSRINRATQEAFAASVLSRNTILELDGLSRGATQFLGPLLFMWLYQVRLGSADREHLRYVIFLEEAHHFLYGDRQRSRESTMEMLLRQCREVGLAFVAIDQHPSLLGRAALNNAYCSIVFNLKDQADVNRGAALSQVSVEDRRFLSFLPVGHAVCKLQGRWTRPLLLHVPRVDVAKGAVRDEILVQLANKSGARSPYGPPAQALERHVPRVPLGDELITADMLAFIQEVVSHPMSWVREHYERLGWGGTRGNLVQRQLVRSRWLERGEIRVGNTRRIILRLSSEAHAALGLPRRPGTESIAHEYWKLWYAKMLADDGFDVQVEALRNGGRVDLLARRGHELIGVEVETGKSDVVKNVQSCLRAGCTHVLVIATDTEAMNVAERRLAIARLLIPRRVQVIKAPDPLPQAWRAAAA